MESHQIEFRFKGARDYIHGTDMFNAIIGIHPPASLRNVQFTIHGIVRSARCQVYQGHSREELRELRDVKVRATFVANGVLHWIALTESAAPVRPDRYEYPEDHIVELCDIREHSVAIKAESPFSFIETIVAMNKHLHQTLFTDARGNWMFTGITLEEGCAARSQISLQLGPDPNYRLTRAAIEHEGKVIGTLLFSLARP